MSLPAVSAQLLALALHELATNAVKYGALHDPAGRLEIRWRIDEEVDERRAHIEWLESSVVMPHPGSRRKGDGSELLGVCARSRKFRTNPQIVMSDEIRQAVPQPLTMLHPGGAIEIRRVLPRDPVRGIAGAAVIVGALNAMDGVAAAPSLTGQVILRHAGRDYSVTCIGVDPPREARVTDVVNDMVEGSFEALASNPDGLLIGRQLADKMGVGLGDSVTACRDVQDIEFTVERGRLWSCRPARPSARRASLRIAVDLVDEGIISRAEAVARVAEVDLAAARAAKAAVASPGVACGRVCFTTERAKETAARGEPAILVRRDTSTEDVAGFVVADGILTAVGGRTSHAAVVARQMGKVCLVGCRALAIDERQGSAALDGQTMREGDWIALDGGSGEISLGRRAIVAEDAPETATTRRWREEASPSAAPPPVAAS